MRGKRSPVVEIDGVSKKWCCRCNTYLPVDKFSKQKASFSGLQSFCKDCDYKNQKSYKKRNAEKVTKAAHRSRLKFRFGLSPEEVASMFETQNHLCKICKLPLSMQRSSVEYYRHIDHCHKTGKVRGLLCGPCNKMLGFAKDNPDTLLSAVAYLK